MGFKISDMGHFQVMIEVGVEVGSCSLVSRGQDTLKLEVSQINYSRSKYFPAPPRCQTLF